VVQQTAETTPTCRACARPVADQANLCGTCTDALCYELRRVPEIMDDLLITRTKQDAVATRYARVSGTRERPLGYRPAASEAADLMVLTLAYWTRIILAARGLHTRQAASPVHNARWLARHRETIRHHDGAADLLDEIRYAIGHARETIDRPPERIYSGRCVCGGDLYARERSHQVACPVCGKVYAVADRRAAMLDEIREHLATAAEIAAGIGELHGQQINRKTINQWNSRDRLVVRGYSTDGHPLFRIGDVLDLAVPPTRRRADPGATVA
jgi:hypothetical protein